MIITDLDLARAWLLLWQPEPGQTYSAPAASLALEYGTPVYRPTGAPLDPAAAVFAPVLADALQRHRKAVAASPSSTPAEPTLAALVADYAAATAPLQGTAGNVVPAGTFSARLAACRQCALWDEAGRQGKGRCQSVRCQCAKRLLWLSAETCPEHHWQA